MVIIVFVGFDDCGGIAVVLLAEPRTKRLLAQVWFSRVDFFVFHTAFERGRGRKNKLVIKYYRADRNAAIVFTAGRRGDCSSPAQTMAAVFDDNFDLGQFRAFNFSFCSEYFFCFCPFLAERACGEFDNRISHAGNLASVFQLAARKIFALEFIAYFVIMGINLDAAAFTAWLFGSRRVRGLAVVFGPSVCPFSSFSRGHCLASADRVFDYKFSFIRWPVSFFC